MLTWQLWRRVLYPPLRHPLFTRIRDERHVTVPRSPWRMQRLIQIGVSAGVVGLALFLIPLWLVLILYAVVGIALGSVLFGGAVYGGWRVAGISQALAHEYEQSTREVLRVTPMGGAALDWLVSAAHLHRQNRLAQLQSLMQVILRTGGLGFFVLAMYVLLTMTTSADATRQALSSSFFEALCVLLAGAGILYLDYVQSILTACLVAMLAAHITRAKIQAGVTALVSYSALQVGIYLTALVVAALIWQMTQVVDPPPLWTALRALLLLLGFYSVREAVIGILWRISLHYTQTTIAEWRAA